MRLSALIPVLCLPILLAYIYLERYSFPQDDDYQFAADAIRHGILGNVAYGYRNWEGRFSSYFLNSLIGSSSLFPYHTNLFMIVSLALFVCALALVLWKREGIYSHLLWLDMAFIFLALPYPIKKSAFYYMVVNIVYLLPVTMTCFVMVFLDRPVQRRFEKYLLLSLGVLFIVIAGFNQLIAMTLIICICGYLLGLYPQVPQVRRLVAMLLGTMIGFVIEVIAPGNFVRLLATNKGHFPGVIDIAIRTLDELRHSLPFFTACFAYGLLRIFFTPAPAFGICKTGRSACWYVISVLTVVVATFYIVIYGYNGTPPTARTLLIPYLVTFIAALDLTRWFALAYPLPRYVYRGYALCRYMLLLPLLIVVSYLPIEGFNNLIKNLKRGSEMRSAGLAQIDSAYRAKEEKCTARLKVNAMPSHNVDMFFGSGVVPDSEDTNNRNLAKYFGLDKVESNRE